MVRKVHARPEWLPAPLCYRPAYALLNSGERESGDFAGGATSPAAIVPAASSPSSPSLGTVAPRGEGCDRARSSGDPRRRPARSLTILSVEEPALSQRARSVIGLEPCPRLLGLELPHGRALVGGLADHQASLGLLELVDALVAVLQSEPVSSVQRERLEEWAQAILASEDIAVTTLPGKVAIQVAYEPSIDAWPRPLGDDKVLAWTPGFARASDCSARA
jgi:hypothetical protein